MRQTETFEALMPMCATSKLNAAVSGLAVMLLVAGGIYLIARQNATMGDHSKAAIVSVAPPATMPTTEPIASGAALVYLRAADLIKGESPSSSDLEYVPNPPFSAAWLELARNSWEQNAAVRDLVRSTRGINAAGWPTGNGYGYLNECRHLANEIGDAALYEQVVGRHAAAVERVRDLFQFTGLLAKNQSERSFVRFLVAVGIDAMALERLMVIASGAPLTADPANETDVQVATVRELIAQLVVQADAEALVKSFIVEPISSGGRASVERAIETLRRTDAACTLAAMSLACHLFQFEHGRWPVSLKELSPSYLPTIPPDPWGDGKQTFGYVLIRGGLPDGTDRPLVYDRCRSREGLFYRTDEPQYGFYAQDGSNRPANEQLQGGQFLDVARWNPANPPVPALEPAMQALP